MATKFWQQLLGLIYMHAYITLMAKHEAYMPSWNIGQWGNGKICPGYNLEYLCLVIMSTLNVLAIAPVAIYCIYCMTYFIKPARGTLYI